MFCSLLVVLSKGVVMYATILLTTVAMANEVDAFCKACAYFRPVLSTNNTNISPAGDTFFDFTFSPHLSLNLSSASHEVR